VTVHCLESFLNSILKNQLAATNYIDPLI